MREKNLPMFLLIDSSEHPTVKYHKQVRYEKNINENKRFVQT
jgi:hypothetical protein